MRVFRFLIYCAGWVALAVSLATLAVAFLAVFVSDSLPWWLLGLLGDPVAPHDELWSSSVHPYIRAIHFVALVLLAFLTIGIGALHARFAKRHGFWLPAAFYEDPYAPGGRHEGGPRFD